MFRCFYLSVLVGFFLTVGSVSDALRNDEVLVIVNNDIQASERVGAYYVSERGLPDGNIVKLSLGSELRDTISRDDYERLIAEPVREALSQKRHSVVKCLVTTYGVPFRVGARGLAEKDKGAYRQLNEKYRNCKRELMAIDSQLRQLSVSESGGDFDQGSKLEKIVSSVQEDGHKAIAAIKSISEKGRREKEFGQWLELYSKAVGVKGAAETAREVGGFSPYVDVSERLRIEEAVELFSRAEREGWSVKDKLAKGYYGAVGLMGGLASECLRCEFDIDHLRGKESSAAVDSELAMVRFEDYELNRWQDNEFAGRMFWYNVKTVMVSRLDGPSEGIAKGLVDKAVTADAGGLKGTVYLDAGHSKNKGGNEIFARYDESIIKSRDVLAGIEGLLVVVDQGAGVFETGSCPEAAVYCGWYSLAKYVDAFDFVDGAIGLHIASFEGRHIRSAESTEWMASMLRDGAAVVIGPVDEPYLHSFPLPDKFFGELKKGRTVGESYFKVKPFNSWRMMLIGDPLYRPFK
jgi:uncharacterized protein (TIGR03790 family)